MKRLRLPLPDRLALLGGANLNALKGADTSRSSFQQMGLAILVTAAVAVVSMSFALTDAVGVYPPLAIPFALAWGGVIFTLDRLLITVGMGTSLGSTLAMTAVRVVVAALIGFLVSTPLVMRVFAPDINYQLSVMRAENSKDIEKQIAQSNEQQVVDDLKADIAVQDSILLGVLPHELAKSDGAAVVSGTSRLDALKAQLAEAQHASDQASILYNCEVYGGGRDKLDDPSKCAPEPGFNGNADLYAKQRDEAARRLADIQEKVNVEQRRVDAAAAGQRADQEKLLAGMAVKAPGVKAGLQRKLVVAQDNLDKLTVYLEGGNNGNQGMLARLEALERASEESPTLRWAHWLLAALFCMIELMPVLAKVMWSFGKRAGAYEQVLALEETDSFNALLTEKSNQAKLREQDARLTLERNERLAKLASEEIEKTQREDLLRQIESWKSDIQQPGNSVTAVIPPQRPAPATGPVNGPVNGSAAP
jgi:hypothetical protein